MKRFVSLVLYITYLAIVLTRPTRVNSTEKDFNIVLPMIISITAIVFCTLIIIIRPHLVEQVYSRQNLLFNAAYILVSVLLFIWTVCNTGNINFLLIALLTENIYDFALLITKKYK